MYIYILRLTTAQFVLFLSCRFTTFRNDKLPHESNCKNVELFHHVTGTKKRAVSECRRVSADREKSSAF